MIIIGVDPGSVKTGWGVVRKDGNRLVRLGSGVIRTSAKDAMEDRILSIHRALDEVLTLYGPDQAGVEDLFFSKNASSALKLGQVRGAIILTLRRRDVPVASYPPALVKRAIVGAGRADKSQVSLIVQSILKMETLPYEDEGDALAIAICHANAPPRPIRAVAASTPPAGRRRFAKR